MSKVFRLMTAGDGRRKKKVIERPSHALALRTPVPGESAVERRARLARLSDAIWAEDAELMDRLAR